MRFILAFVVLGIVGAASAVSWLNYSAWDDWASVQNTTINSTTNLFVQSYETSTGSTWTQTTYAGNTWGASITRQPASPRKITFTSSSGSTILNAITLESNSYSGNLTLNGSVKSTCSGACDLTFSVGLYNSNGVYNATWYAFTFLNATPYLQVFTVSGKSISPGQKIRITYSNNGVSTNDVSEVDNLTISGYVVFGLLVIQAKDELNLGVKTANFTISNSTNSTTYTGNGVWFNKTINEVPSGQLTVQVSNHTCLTGNPLPRSYQVNTLTDSTNFTAYLLCDGSSPSLVSFYVQDYYEHRLAGASVVAKKSIGGTLVPVTSALTDSTGVSALYLDINTAYQITVSLGGYSTVTSYVTPSQSSYTVTMYSSNSSVGFQTMFDGLAFNIQPETSYLFGDAQNLSSLSFYLNDTLSQLNFWGWNVSDYQGAQLYFQNYTAAPGGGLDSVSVNLTLHPFNATVLYWFSRANYSAWTYNRTFIINPVESGGLSDALRSPAQNGASKLMLSIIGAIIAAFLTVPFSRIIPQGAGIIALFVMGLIAYSGGLTWGVYALTVFTYFGYMMMVRI